MNDPISYLKNIPLFSHLDDKEILSIAESSKVQSYQKGQILFYEKDDTQDIFYVLNGSIKLYKVDRFDNEIFLYKVDPESFLFDFAKMDEAFSFGQFANAEFMEDTTVLCIDTESFKRYFLDDPVIQRSIYKELLSTLKRFQCVVNRDIVYDGIAKVAHMLVTDIESFNNLKKHEIAYMLHIQPETLSRILKKLERNNAILVQKGIIKIIDKQTLINIYD